MGSFSHRITSLSWTALRSFLVTLCAGQLFLLVLMASGLAGVWAAAGVGLAAALSAWLAITWYRAQTSQWQRTDRELRAAYEHLAETHRQLLAVHDIGAEIASAADIQRVLELAARAPGQLTGALGSAFVSFDGEQNRLHLDMAWGLSETYVNALRQRIEAGIPSERCRLCSPLKAHVSGDCPLFDGLQTLAQADGIQSLACVPLYRDRTREGILTAYFPSPDGPPEEQIQLLNIVMTEIAAALEGVRLRQQQMTALYTMEHLTRVEQDLDQLLHQVLETSLNGWGVAHGAILLWDPARQVWSRWAQRGLGQPDELRPFGLAVRLADEARLSGRPVLIADLSTQPGLAAGNLNGIRSAAADVLISGGQTLGALVMAAAQRGRFAPATAAFFSAMAHQAALAIANAQLHAQVQTMAIAEERFRLAREIHDGLAQTLSALGWELEHLQGLLQRGDTAVAAEILAGARQALREATLDVREAIDGLRLASDHPQGLPGALAEYVADFADRTGIEIQFQIGDAVGPLSPVAELQLLRIVQESLTNVRKHAAAQHARVALNGAPDQVELTIVDDGKGFDPYAPRGRQHVGLTGMRERAHSLGGRLTLATSPGQGTRITVTVPLQASQP